MSADTSIWLLILGLAAVAFLTRALFIVPGARLRLPATLERVLRYAPAAALTAIVVPDLFRVDGTISMTYDNPRLVAGLVAVLVGARTRNILLTIVAGMATLALARLMW